MDPQYQALRAQISHDLVQISIRIALVALTIYTCAAIVAPFAALVLWALILAVTLYPVHARLARRMAGKQGRAALIIVLLGIFLIAVPATLLGMSFADHVTAIFEAYRKGTLAVPEPPPSVESWPIIGERLYSVWVDAAQDFPAWLGHYREPIRSAMHWMLGTVGSTLATIGLFVGALIVAGIMMAYGQSGSGAMKRVVRTIVGANRGDDLHRLGTLSIRSVAMGVVGVAVIQALILGVLFLLAGIPAAGVLSVITLILGILQLPALLLTIPVIGYLWAVGDGSTIFNVAMTVLIIIGGFSDGVLKPMLLGRGVDVPMPVVLIGALGGMIAMGMIGLFLGAVVLSVGYRLFMHWVDLENQQLVAEPEEGTEGPVDGS